MRRVLVSPMIALSALAVGVQLGCVHATEPKVFRDADGGELPYRWHAPATVEPGARYPLVLFLHGAGERGRDNRAQLKHGIGDILKWCEENRQPCFLLAPQCPADEWWAPIDRETMGAIPGAKPTAPMQRVIRLLDEVTVGQPVDPARFYVTGISMGGYGTWFLLATMPERIAAAAPVCGGGDPARATAFKAVPLWVFHGARDEVVPPAASRRMIEAIQQAGGQPKFTEYPDLQHDSWTRTYRNPEVLAWLFAQRRGGQIR